MSWTFKAPWWGSALVTLACLGMGALGVWQLQRAADKEARLALYAAADQQTPRTVQAGSFADPERIERARIRGQFDVSRQLLLDNQSQDGRPGLHVWTPVLIADGSIVVVDRGWVPQRGDRTPLADLAAPAGEVELLGYWRTLPAPGLRTEADNCAAGPWPRIVQYPTPADLQCLYGEFAAEGLFLLDPTAPGGYSRQWTTAPELSPRKHYGYAVQWFALALTLAGLFIKFNLRRA
ncbi:MAG TPA: SURF1 family protein [Solimonas sp.]|nr:SURF1 family protein [Solimonas sp.]